MFRKLLIVSGMLCLLSGAEAKAQDTAYAYCPLGEGYVFLYDSADGFQVLANLKCGEKLQVVDASDRTRTKVRTANGREGWVPKTSLNVPVAPKASQAAVPANPVPQAPQTQTPRQAPVLPQRQPASPEQPKSQPQQVKAQPETQAQASQPVQQMPAPPLITSQPGTAAQAQTEPESEPLPHVQELAQSQSEQQAQPEVDVKLEAAAEPQPEAMPQPEPQPQPQPEAQPEAQPQPEAQSEVQGAPKAQTQFQSPQPAATAFTPFSSLGYEYVPRLEVYGGYGFLNAGTSGLASRQNVSGVEASVDVHINRWIAGELNGGVYIKTLNIINVGSFAYHDFLGMAGPRFNIRKMFFHALVGVDHLAGSGNFYTVGNTLTNNALAGGGGGGVQWNVTRQFALRTSADYIMSRFEGLTQNNVRFTLGIVFQAGNVRAE